MRWRRSKAVGVVKHFVLRTAARSATWTIGLALAAKIVPHVALSVSGLIVAAVFFSITQTTLSLKILKLPYGYASLLLGSTGLILTLVAMGLASLSTHGLSIYGAASWLAATVMVWLVTTIGAILLFDVYLPRYPAQARVIHRY
jgi:hypothetical protein